MIDDDLFDGDPPPEDERGLSGGDAGLSPDAAEARLTWMRTVEGAATDRLGGNPSTVLAAWGAAWLLGFGAVWLNSAHGVGPSVSATTTGMIIAAGLSVAAVASVRLGVTRRRGVDGRTRWVSTMYGWTWVLALVAEGAINLGLAHQGLPARLRPLLWTATSLLIVGLLYLALGIVMHDLLQYGLGAWTLVVGAVAVTVGTPSNFAVLAFAGGGGFLGAAVRARVRARVQAVRR